MDAVDTADIPIDSLRCPVCSHQIASEGIRVPVQPSPTFTSLTSVIDINSDDQDDPVCSTNGKTGAEVRPKAPNGRLVRSVMPKIPIQAVSPAKIVGTSDVTSRTIYDASGPTHPFRHSMAIDQDQTLGLFYCSDQCRFADRKPYHGAIDIRYNLDQSTSPCLPPSPANSLSDTYDSQGDSDRLSEASSDTTSSTSSLCAANAYSRLCAIYGFAPLPPPPPYAHKPTPSVREPVPRLEGGIIMAARRIQTALCIDKHKKSSWGLPIHDNSEDDNEPIPGWTDGSNAWRASTYGFAPPRDFTRTDPDDAAIRAYGSYVATPHRSRSVHSALSTQPTVEAQTTSSSSFPSNAIDASTQELYRQYCASFTRRSQSRTSVHLRGKGFSTSPTGSTRYTSPSPSREVPLLKPGAEGRLLVPNVKMQVVNSAFSRLSVDGSPSKPNSFVLGGRHCTPSQQKSDAGPDPNRAQSYESEAIMYPIMRVTPKKEKRVERRVVDGVERDFEVEVLIEEPIKRLFLFGGARD